MSLLKIIGDYIRNIHRHEWEEYEIRKPTNYSGMSSSFIDAFFACDGDYVTVVKRKKCRICPKDNLISIEYELDN
jgi:hypothetical protein